MFLSNDELKTVLYAENILAVSGGDDTLVTAAIQGAIAEAKSHLSRFDKTALFDTPTGDQRNPLLLIFVKDIAVWHFLNLANPGTSLEFRRSRYNAAIQWLKDVNSGDADADFPLLPVADNGGGTIFYGSNPKGEKHY
jgi:phage gp36-like protein